ncbi:hypothetical protein AAG570_001485 [Ranatra chinensis]|uniref:Uncharacterized protein n=1 Tax=Ranatra chinensis TaxID=642074 RepID=A0ABD0YMQ5_9HEMI
MTEIGTCNLPSFYEPALVETTFQHGPVSQYTSSDGNRNTTEPNGITTTTTATTITTTTTTGDNKPTRPDHQANKQLQFDDAYSQRNVFPTMRGEGAGEKWLSKVELCVFFKGIRTSASKLRMIILRNKPIFIEEALAPCPASAAIDDIRTQWVSGWPAYQKPTQLVTNINYRQPQPQQPQPEPQLYSPVDSLADYEEGQDSCSSSEDFTPDGDCSDSDFEERSSSLPARGIVNPNYPGFQHLAHQLHSPQQDTFNNNNNNNDEEEEDLNHLGESEEEEYTKEIDAFNRLDSDPAPAKPAYSRPKLNIPLEPTDNRAALEVKEVNKLACLPEAESPARHQPPGAKKAEESEEEEEERGRLEAAQPTKREKTEMNLTVQKGAPANIHYHLPPANMISNNNNNNNNQYNRTQHTVSAACLQEMQSQQGDKLHITVSVVSCLVFFAIVFCRLDTIFSVE